MSDVYLGKGLLGECDAGACLVILIVCIIIAYLECDVEGVPVLYFIIVRQEEEGIRDVAVTVVVFFVSSRRRHTRCSRDWSSDVCSSDPCKLIVSSVSF